MVVFWGEIYVKNCKLYYNDDINENGGWYICDFILGGSTCKLYCNDGVNFFEIIRQLRENRVFNRKIFRNKNF